MAVGEWDQRQLCSDGACVGVIGADGTCKTCGRAAPNWGDERKRGLIDPPDEDVDEDVEDAGADLDDGAGDDYGGEDGEDGDDGDNGEDDGDDGDGEADRDREIRASSASSSGTAWTARRLCPDGNCVGVIGASGRCKVCGRTAGDAPEDPAISPGDSAAAPASEPEPNSDT